MYDEVLTVRRPIISICSIPPSALSIYQHLKPKQQTKRLLKFMLILNKGKKITHLDTEIK